MQSCTDSEIDSKMSAGGMGLASQILVIGLQFLYPDHVVLAHWQMYQDCLVTNEQECLNWLVLAL